MWFCLFDVTLDTRAEGRHPPSWLLLPWRRRWRRHYCKCVVWAQRYRVSSSPRPSAELPGSGNDIQAVSWIQLVSKICPVITVCLPRGISLCIYIRLWEANTFAYIPQRTQTSCTLINHSSFITPVRWDWQSIEIVHVEPANICSISNFWLLPCRWRWRIQTQNASPSLPRLRIWNVCYSLETCCSSPSDTGIMFDP